MKPPLDWSYLQSFVAVAEHQSLSAAARATGSSQPTLSRHIAQLETILGARLFDRTKAGVTLTQKGSDVLAHATAMADAAGRLSFLQGDQGAAMEGTVRITASQIVATFVLPDILTALHARHPNIAIELVASDDTNNLLRREADIALRMYRPTQGDVISQLVGHFELAAYAAPSYLAASGPLEHPADILKHDVIGYDRSTLIIDGLKAFGLSVDRDFFKFRSDDQVVCWQMVRAGYGIGFNQRAIGDADDRVQRLFGAGSVGQMPLWLTAHPELRGTPRVRRVYDALKEHLSMVVSRP